MTYNVFSGTLNPAQSVSQYCYKVLKIVDCSNYWHIIVLVIVSSADTYEIVSCVNFTSLCSLLPHVGRGA